MNEMVIVIVYVYVCKSLYRSIEWPRHDFNDTVKCVTREYGINCVASIIYMRECRLTKRHV